MAKIGQRYQAISLVAFQRGCRMLAGGILVLASIAKISDSEDFLIHVNHYQLAGPRIAAVIALGLPWLELLTGLCLMLNILIRAACIAAVAMFASFTGAQLLALHRGLTIDCGCGLKGMNGEVGWTSVARSIFLLLVGLAAWISSRECDLSPLTPALEETQLCVH